MTNVLLKVKGLQVGAEGNWFFLNNAWLER